MTPITNDGNITFQFLNNLIFFVFPSSKKKLHTTLCYFVSVVNFFTSPDKALLLLYCTKNLLHFAVYA